MCVICREWENGGMTSTEALRAAGEILQTSKKFSETGHALEVIDKIMETEAPSKYRDENIEKLAIDLVEDEKKDKYGSS